VFDVSGTAAHRSDLGQDCWKLVDCSFARDFARSYGEKPFSFLSIEERDTIFTRNGSAKDALQVSFQSNGCALNTVIK